MQACQDMGKQLFGVGVLSFLVIFGCCDPNYCG